MKPNLFLVGAAKSATTTLYRLLAEHPDVFMTANKEPHFLCCEHFPDPFVGPGDEGFQKNTVRSGERYERLFDAVQDERVIGEASVFYLTFPDTAEKIRQLNADARVVMVLRNPVDRAFSAFMQTVRDGREWLTFEAGLRAEPERIRDGFGPLWWYRRAGMYSASVQHYLDVFGPARARVYLYDDLREPARVIDDLWAFLEVSPIEIAAMPRANVSGRPSHRRIYDFFAKPNAARKVLRHLAPAPVRRRVRRRALTSLRHERLPDDVRATLAEDYREDVLALQDILGRSLAAWLPGGGPAGPQPPYDSLAAARRRSSSAA